MTVNFARDQRAIKALTWINSASISGLLVDYIHQISCDARLGRTDRDYQAFDDLGRYAIERVYQTQGSHGGKFFCYMLGYNRFQDNALEKLLGEHTIYPTEYLAYATDFTSKTNNEELGLKICHLIADSKRTGNVAALQSIYHRSVSPMIRRGAFLSLGRIGTPHAITTATEIFYAGNGHLADSLILAHEKPNEFGGKKLFSGILERDNLDCFIEGIYSDVLNAETEEEERKAAEPLIKLRDEFQKMAGGTEENRPIGLEERAIATLEEESSLKRLSYLDIFNDATTEIKARYLRQFRHKVATADFKSRIMELL